MKAWPFWWFSMGILLLVASWGLLCAVSTHRIEDSLSTLHIRHVSVPLTSKSDEGDFATQLPRVMDADALIADVYKVAALNGVTVSHLANAMPVSGTSMALGRSGINVKLSGSYLGLMAVVSKILSSHAGMTIQKLSISRNLDTSSVPQAAFMANNAPAVPQTPTVSAAIALTQWSRPLP